MSLIADTGFFLALVNRSYRHHARAVEVLEALHEPLVTTWPVLTETAHLLQARLGQGALLSFMGSVAHQAVDVFRLDASHLPRIVQLMKKYGDLPMDLADASLVLLAEVQNDGRILSTDQRDFRTYRWKHRKPFKNLLLH